MQNREYLGDFPKAEERTGRRPIPSGWGQAFPRCVLLAPDGLLVPASTLKVLLARGATIPLRYVGFALAPWIGHDREIQVRGGVEPVPGDLALCDAGGWGDIRRVLARTAEGTYVTGLDSFPSGREEVAGQCVLGVVVGDRAPGAAGRVVASGFPLWSRLAALRYWYRKIQEAPLFGSDATASIARKYERQVESYAGILGEPLDPWILSVLQRLVPRGGSILVAGSGSGREALQLAR